MSKEDKVQSDASRRKMMKLVSGAGISALALPGMAAADAENNGRGKGRGRQTSPEIRARKAEKEGKEWNEDWIDSDRIDETWSTAEEEVTTQGRSISGEIGVKGISISFEAYFGECEGWLEVSALGQSERVTLTCSSYCRSLHLDGGAAYVDIDGCYNWDTNTLSIDVEGCVWHLTGWSCASLSEEY